jgi:hypothetical protein
VFITTAYTYTSQTAPAARTALPKDRLSETEWYYTSKYGRIAREKCGM